MKLHRQQNLKLWYLF